VSGHAWVLLAAWLLEHVDLDLAGGLGERARVIEVRRARESAFSRATVYALEEPIPVPAGTSATDAISSGFPRQWRSSDSRTIGCLISRGESTSSVSEYFIL
jgi:hypothetical protein